MDKSRALVWMICVVVASSAVFNIASSQKIGGMQYLKQSARYRAKSGSVKKNRQKFVKEYVEDMNAPDEQRLMAALLFNYEPASRPVYNASSVVQVKFGLTLAQIFDVDEVNQVLTTNVWLEQEWTDERLRWNPANYSGLHTLRIPCQRIWLPDIVLYNSADDFTEGFMQSRAMVTHEGVVFWPPPAKLRSSCKIDITYFPFDDQRCRMKFGSWTYDGFQVDIVNRSAHVDLANYVFSGEWELLDISVKRNAVYYACCVEPFPDVTFMFMIRRRTLYYLFNIIFPCLWLTVLSLLGFWLPPDSGEKVTLGITVLLAFSVFMLLIAESMPATSEFVPLIGIYLTVTMAMTSLSIMLTVFVLQLHHAGPHQKPVPPWLRSLVVHHCSRALCMRSHLPSYYGASDTEDPEDLEGSTTTTMEQGCRLDTPTDAELNAERFPGVFRSNGRLGNSLSFSSSLGALQNMAAATAEGQQKLKSWLDCYRSRWLAGRRPCRAAAPRPMKIRVTKHDQRREYEEVVNEWRLVAHIVDRLLFWLFLVGSLLSTLTILVFMPMTKPSLVERTHAV